MDAKMVEQWINLTLAEADDMKQIPDSIKRSDARFAITRFGIDRIALTNAGVPNEEITRLYKSLFVHSQGFLNLIKELSMKIHDAPLDGSPRKAAR